MTQLSQTLSSTYLVNSLTEVHGTGHRSRSDLRTWVQVMGDPNLLGEDERNLIFVFDLLRMIRGASWVSSFLSVLETCVPFLPWWFVGTSV